MNKMIFVVEEAPEGGYTARALGVSIFTEANTLAELREQVRDAVRCHFDEVAGTADHPPAFRARRSDPGVKLPVQRRRTALLAPRPGAADSGFAAQVLG